MAERQPLSRRAVAGGAGRRGRGRRARGRGAAIVVASARGRARHARAGADDDRAAAAAEAVPDRLPRGLHARPDGERVDGGREDRRPRAPRPRRSSPARLPRRDAARRACRASAEAADEPRGLPVPGDVRLPARRRRRAARRRPARGVLPQLADGRPGVRAVEEPDAVRRADHRVDGREGGRGARPSGRSIAAVIYNRLHARDAARDRRDAPLRPAHPADAVDPRSRSSQNPTPYNTRLHAGLPPTPIANPGLASLRAAAHPAKVDYLYFVRKPDHRHHFFTASVDRVQRVPRAHGYG